MTPDKPPETRYLPAEELHLWSLPDGAIVLKWRDERHVLGAPKRALPLSEPDRFILLYDDEGEEIGTLRDVNELTLAAQAVLRDALQRAYRIERITRILDVEREPLSGQTKWRVELAEDENEDADSSAADIVSRETTSPEEEHGQGEARDGKLLPAVKRLLKRHSDDAEDPEPPASRIHTREREFLISGQEDVATARYPHIFIVDTERNRYEIPNCELLDPDSRRTADRYF